MDESSRIRSAKWMLTRCKGRTETLTSDQRVRLREHVQFLERHQAMRPMPHIAAALIDIEKRSSVSYWLMAAQRKAKAKQAKAEQRRRLDVAHRLKALGLL